MEFNIGFNLNMYIIVAIVSLVTVAGFVMWLKINLRKIQVRCHEIKHENKRIKNNLKNVTTGTIGFGEKVNKLSKEVQYLYDIQAENLASNNTVCSGNPYQKTFTDSSRLRESVINNEKYNVYNQAKRIATEGGSVEDLVDICGVSKTEAELIFNLVKK